MKHIFFFILTVLLIASCTPDKYELGQAGVTPEDLVEGIAFEITHDKDNPNIVYLISKMDKKYNALWQHPQGNSQGSKVTLRMPFEGTYDVVFGVQTPGGAVFGEAVQFKIDGFYADFVNDPLWTMLTGGVGKSKTWIHDNGQYGLASGEMDYADPSKTQDFDNFEVNWSPGAGHTGDENIWKSTMTFKLDGGAFVENHNEGGPDESGTFMIDTDNHTITFSNANLIHTPGWESKTSNWARGLKIFTLNENQLRVGVMREKATSGEDPWWLIWNFVSKEYADNYVPEEKEDPVPDIGGDPNEVLTTTKTKQWYLSVNSPYDWADLNGNLENNFQSPLDYINSGNPYEETKISGFNISMTATDATTGTYVLTEADNTEYKGTYKVDKNNDITFDVDIDFVISGDIKLATTSEKKLRIIKVATDMLGNITEMWLGKRDESGEKKYTAYHFELKATPADQDAAVKNLLCAHEWKIDVKGNKFGGPLTYANPVSFPELTSPWTPDIPSNTWLMIDGDHGSMKFNKNGSVTVTQRTVVSGAFDETIELKGTWTYSGEDYKLTLDIPILHADNFSKSVRNWGDARLQSVGEDFLRLCVVRDPELSGESEYYLVFNYVPAE